MNQPWRRRNALALYEQRVGPNMTPMVDVMLVLLIFFMATAVLAGPEWFLGALLPAPASADTGDSRGDPLALGPATFTLRLAVGEDGVTMATGLGSPPMPVDRLGSILKDLSAGDGGGDGDGGGVIVLVWPAPDVPYQDVVRVFELCREAGIERAGLLDRPGG